MQHTIFLYTDKKAAVSKTAALYFLVGVKGFEPSTPCTPCKCATRLRHTPTR